MFTWIELAERRLLVQFNAETGKFEVKDPADNVVQLHVPQEDDPGILKFLRKYPKVSLSPSAKIHCNRQSPTPFGLSSVTPLTIAVVSVLVMTSQTSNRCFSTQQSLLQRATSMLMTNSCRFSK